MKHLLLALLVLAVAPTVEAQYESAYYGLSLGEFDYEAKAAGRSPILRAPIDSWSAISSWST